MSEYTPQVSVIIVTHNSLPVLADCLEALGAAVRNLSHEVIIVDNASVDGSVDEAARLFPRAAFLKNERNCGFARACNRGAETASGEFILFLNPDLVIDPEAVAVLVAEARDRPEAGLISGRLRHADGSFQPTCRRFPTITNMVFARGSAVSRLLRQDESGDARYTLPDYRETTEVPAVAATMVLVRRELFAQVGGFDNRYFMYMEDTDLSLRLKQAGRVNVFVPGAGGVHHWGRGGRAGRLTRLRRHHMSIWKYFLKHFPNGFSVILLPLLLALNFLALMILPRGQPEVGRR